jgi:hypothetical protein
VEGWMDSLSRQEILREQEGRGDRGGVRYCVGR